VGVGVTGNSEKEKLMKRIGFVLLCCILQAAALQAAYAFEGAFFGFGGGLGF
jgi:hypothetical protein